MKVELIFKDAWNTGRGYSEHGQRIAVYSVVVDGEAKALFMVDVDRHLEYFYELPPSWNHLRNYVLVKYDHNKTLSAWDQPWYQWVRDSEVIARRDARTRNFPTWRV